MNRKIKRFEAKCALIIKFRSFGKFDVSVCGGGKLSGFSILNNVLRFFRGMRKRVLISVWSDQRAVSKSCHVDGDYLIADGSLVDN